MTDTASGERTKTIMSYHMSISIAGVLKYTKRQFNKEFTGVFRDDNGKVMTYEQVRDVLLEHQSQGHKVIPCGDCDNFDWQSGCHGHARNYRYQP